jgi:ABC-type phosphate transport system substrate-binding protein
VRIPVWSIAAQVLLAAVGLMSCGGVASSKQGADVRLQGAGASFPFPIYIEVVQSL